MFWQETQPDENFVVPDDVVDVSYRISCRDLPVDHAWALSRAVCEALPWIPDEAGAGVHTIHVADSGNGWMRPEGTDELLLLSKRTRLVLRIPRARYAEAAALTGKTLDIAGHALRVEEAAIKPLSVITTIFSRYVVSAAVEDENAFLTAMVKEMNALGVRPKKMLCGMEKQLATPDGPIRARSLMVAELTQDESVALQRRGLGPRRELGCGLFIPHKDIREVKQVLD